SYARPAAPFPNRWRFPRPRCLRLPPSPAGHRYSPKRCAFDPALALSPHDAVDVPHLATRTRFRLAVKMGLGVAIDARWNHVDFVPDKILHHDIGHAARIAQRPA